MYMWMTILGLGVVYMADDDEQSCSRTPTYEISI